MKNDRDSIERTRQATKTTHKAHVEAVIVHTTEVIKSISKLLDKQAKN